MNSVSSIRPQVSSSTKRQAAARLRRAVRQNPAFSAAGIAERLFARVFSGLVYAQIWEDPDVDMEALAIEPGNRIVAIASGGCNALSYLLADPAIVEAVDLNLTHVARETNRLTVARDVTGATCINQYVVVKTLGRGSYGKVKLCLNTFDGQLYAIKVGLAVSVSLRLLQVSFQGSMLAWVEYLSCALGVPSLFAVCLRVLQANETNIVA